MTASKQTRKRSTRATRSTRDQAGKFVPGNPGGPGRPPMVTEQSRLAMLHQLVSQPAWEAIVLKAVAQAMAGDPTARQWLSRYLLPPPDEGTTTLGVAAFGGAAGMTFQEIMAELRKDPAYMKYAEDCALRAYPKPPQRA